MRTTFRIKRITASLSALGFTALCLAGQPALATPDRPEPGLQGQNPSGNAAAQVLPVPHSKGINLVGHTDIWDRGGNLQLAWVDHCAYVSSSSPKLNLPGFNRNPAADPARLGVAVIDVRNPRRPRSVGVLREAGALNATETLHAVSAPGRKVLVAGAYAGGQRGNKPDDAAWLDIYDASQCSSPPSHEPVHLAQQCPHGHRLAQRTARLWHDY